MVTLTDQLSSWLKRGKLVAALTGALASSSIYTLHAAEASKTDTADKPTVSEVIPELNATRTTFAEGEEESHQRSSKKPLCDDYTTKKKATGHKVYEVKKGDVAFTIAKKEGVHVCDLGLKDPSKLSVGQKLNVPVYGEQEKEKSGIVKSTGTNTTLINWKLDLEKRVGLNGYSAGASVLSGHYNDVVPGLRVDVYKALDKKTSLIGHLGIASKTDSVFTPKRTSPKPNGTYLEGHTNVESKDTIFSVGGGAATRIHNNLYVGGEVNLDYFDSHQKTSTLEALKNGGATLAQASSEGTENYRQAVFGAGGNLIYQSLSGNRVAFSIYGNKEGANYGVTVGIPLDNLGRYLKWDSTPKAPKASKPEAKKANNPQKKPNKRGKN